MRYLTVREVAEVLRLHPETVRQKLRSGEIPAKRLGRKWLVDPVELDLRLTGGSWRKEPEP